VTAERDPQSLKQSGLTFSTEKGMQTDESDEQSRNTELSMQDNSDSDSNATTDRDVHPTKQLLDRVLRTEGMQIDESEQQCAKA
jgi:hypothetical protein